MERELTVYHQKEEDVLFVLEQGNDPNETWNVQMNNHWTVQLSSKFRAVGYIITNASGQLPKVVRALPNPPGCEEEVKQYFDGLLTDLNKALEDAYKSVSESVVRQVHQQRRGNLALA